MLFFLSNFLLLSNSLNIINTIFEGGHFAPVSPIFSLAAGVCITFTLVGDKK